MGFSLRGSVLLYWFQEFLLKFQGWLATEYARRQKKQEAKIRSKKWQVGWGNWGSGANIPSPVSPKWFLLGFFGFYGLQCRDLGSGTPHT